MSRKKKETTALVPWQDELAEAAKRSAQAEKGGGGGLPTISFRGGVISVDDEEVDGGELDVVILQAIHENRYFGAKFAPNNTTGPTTYDCGGPLAGRARRSGEALRSSGEGRRRWPSHHQLPRRSDFRGRRRSGWRGTGCGYPPGDPRESLLRGEVRPE